MPRVLDALAEAGFSDDELDLIAWGNWRRVLDAWWLLTPGRAVRSGAGGDGGCRPRRA